jgi:signal transduction histidine kinase
MNLCANGLEAMPRGGRLVLRTRNADPGEIHLEISDTGAGMEPEVRDRALEPFFTTKGRRKALGIGLAAAYGTTRAHGGRLEIESALGAGTTVRLYLPSCSGDPAQGEAPLGPPEGTPGADAGAAN